MIPRLSVATEPSREPETINGWIAAPVTAPDGAECSECGKPVVGSLYVWRGHFPLLADFWVEYAHQECTIAESEAPMITDPHYLHQIVSANAKIASAIENLGSDDPDYEEKHAALCRISTLIEAAIFREVTHYTPAVDASKAAPDVG